MANIYFRTAAPGENRKGVWYINFVWGRKRYREQVGDAVTKQDAEQYLAKRMREVQRERIYEKPAEPVPFADFVEDFLETDSPRKKSKDRDRSMLATFKVHWKGLNLTDITTKMIEDFKAKRLKHRMPATVNRELQVIKRLFKKAVEWKKLAVSPAVTVKKERVNNSRVRFLEPDEMKRLMSALPDWLEPYVIFARFTGARRGEIFNLTWNDVDFKRGIITFRDTKNGEDGTIIMNDTTRALLASMPQPFNRQQKVFPEIRREGKRNFMTFHRAWEAACRKAKIGKPCGCRNQSADQKPVKGCKACKGSGIVPDFRFHDLRHQAATDLLTLGADLNDVRDFLRHKSMTMTLRYAHLVKARRSRTAHLLDGLSTSGLLRGVVNTDTGSGA